MRQNKELLIDILVVVNDHLSFPHCLLVEVKLAVDFPSLLISLIVD